MSAPRAALALAAGELLACTAAHAGLPRLCDAPVDLPAPEKDRRLRLVQLLREQLDAAGSGVALVSRSGVDLARWAAEYGVPFQMSSRFPVNAIKAARLIIAAEAAGKSGALTQACFAALWVQDRDLTADSELRALATQVGLPADEALAAIETPAVKDRLRAYTDEAIARGVFGAPALFVGTELFWGNDRLHFVEQALRRQSA